MAESTEIDSSHSRQTQNDLGTRIQALTLFEKKVPIPEITQLTSVSKSRIYAYCKTAIQRGYDPNVNPRILLKYVEDTLKPGRPVKATDEVKGQVIKVLKKNSTTRQFSTVPISQAIAKFGMNISVRTVWNILHSLGYSPCKLTTKPGLTAKAKAIRLKWCLEYKDWTLEDWKNVI
ncbi:hypothetical protein B7463_g12725, partial [Scytalidium lignicola]